MIDQVLDGCVILSSSQSFYLQSCDKYEQVGTAISKSDLSPARMLGILNEVIRTSSFS
jgi:hypothetical protein